VRCWLREKEKNLGREPNMGKGQNIRKGEKVREKQRKKDVNKWRLRLLREYHEFEQEIKQRLRRFKPDVSLFGSLARKKKHPRDIDVAIDVRQLSASEFRKLSTEIHKLAKKYPHIDPVLYSWNGKRLPPKKFRDKVRWEKDKWDWYAKI